MVYSNRVCNSSCARGNSRNSSKPGVSHHGNGGRGRAASATPTHLAAGPANYIDACCDVPVGEFESGGKDRGTTTFGATSLSSFSELFQEITEMLSSTWYRSSRNGSLPTSLWSGPTASTVHLLAVVEIWLAVQAYICSPRDAVVSRG